MLTPFLHFVKAELHAVKLIVDFDSEFISGFKFETSDFKLEIFSDRCGGGETEGETGTECLASPRHMPGSDLLCLGTERHRHAAKLRGPRRLKRRLTRSCTAE